ncbi:MAG: dihydropteroate synthase, partial [Pyramidobacter sp.]|nr:dihydropteroate synthase [Pyramidobacter sp.]
VVLELQGALDLPLQVDSSKPEALEAAVRVYAGKPLVNSVSGKASSLSSLLPIVKKYGACVLGLTLDDSGIPQTAEERFAVAEKIVAEAVRLGIPKEDIFIDCLTLTASAQQSLVFETLKAVRMVKERLGVKTVLGVSNVSFGLPRRPLINRTMLALALANGLDAAIMNPGDMGMQDTLAAWRVLSAQDTDSARYISWCASYPAETVSAPAAAKEFAAVSDGSELARAIARGTKDEAYRCAAELLKTCAPLEIVEKQLIPSLDAVGRDYETGTIYLPQLIKSADAAKGAFNAVKEALASQAGTSEAVDTVILATVYGDVHDIGKNIVKVIMQNYNFNVIDLGKDVAPEAIVEAVKKTGVKTVGLSALMTTTVASMKDTIALLRKECPGTRIIIGGAVLTEELAQYVGADVYARDAMATVRAAEQFAAERKQNS